MQDFSLWRFGAFIGSLIPGLIVAILLLRVGERRLSWRLVVVGVAMGATLAVLPLTIGQLEPLVRSADPLLAYLSKAFVFAGLSEEGGKLIACWFIIRTHFERRGRADFILACGAVALGFALIENISYVFHAPDEWKSIALSRSVSAVPMHAFQGLAMGVGLLAAEDRPKARLPLILLTWFAVATLHGFYDLPLFLGEIAPLAPEKINQLAAALSLWTPTLLAAIFLIAVIASCGAAIWAARESAKDAPATGAPTGRIERILYSDATGIVLGGLLMSLAAAALAIGVVARLFGATPSQLLNGATVCAFVGAMGWLIGGRAFSRFGDYRRKAVSAFQAFFARQRLAAIAGAGGAVAASIAAVYWAVAGFRYGVAMLLIISGGTMLSYGQLQPAVDNFATALEFAPTLLLARLARADVHRIMQDYDSALTELDIAVKTHSDDPAAFVARGSIYGEKHQHQRALEEFNKAIALDATNPIAFIGRGGARIELKDYAGALEDAEKALALRPKLSAAHNLRAYAHLEQDDLAGAAAAYDAAIEAEPKDYAAYFSRGRLRFEQGDHQNAVNDFRIALQGPDKRNYVLLWLYFTSARLNMDLRREIAMWATSVPHEAWPFPLIELYLGAGDGDAGLKAVNDDQRCEHAFYVGEAMVAHHMEDGAREMLHRAVELCPSEFIETRAAKKELARLEAEMTGKPREGRAGEWSFVNPAKPTDKGGALRVEATSPEGDTYVLFFTRSAGAVAGAPHIDIIAARRNTETTKPFAAVELRLGEGAKAIRVASTKTDVFETRLAQRDFDALLAGLRDGAQLQIATQQYGRPKADSPFTIKLGKGAAAAAEEALRRLGNAPRAGKKKSASSSR